jgi:hypothetical protein
MFLCGRLFEPLRAGMIAMTLIVRVGGVYGGLLFDTFFGSQRKPLDLTLRKYNH